MKLLFLSLTAVSIALPAHAQAWKYGTYNNVERLPGSACKVEVIDKAKKTENLSCHHIAITGLGADSNSLNFHFDSENERSGISYITYKNGKKNDAGGWQYDVVAFYSRTPDGKMSGVASAAGSCLRSNNASKTVIACTAQLVNGAIFNATLLR